MAFSPDLDGRRGRVEKTVVRDGQGARWVVRARRLRRGDTSRPWPGPEEESLRRRLAGVLAPHPLVLIDPLRGRPDGWRTPGDTADVAMAEALAEFGEPRSAGSDWWAVAQLVRLILDAVDDRRTPWSETWQVEAAARGRIRRWARWEVEGVDAAERTIATVTTALEAGDVPRPFGATLVDVVDQRPAGYQRRAAGLGGARPAG
jgi:hypothetical protein